VVASVKTKTKKPRRPTKANAAPQQVLEQNIPAQKSDDRILIKISEDPKAKRERCFVFQDGVFGVIPYALATQPPISSRWEYKGKWVWLLERIAGDLYTIPDFTKEPEISPEELFQAVSWKEAELLFALKRTLLEKIKVGLMIGLVGLLLLFLFILMSSMEVI